MYEFSYDYIKPKYQRSCTQYRAKLCYMVTDSFVIYIKTKDFDEDIAVGVKNGSTLNTEHKKAKGTKKCVIKRRLLCKNYKDCLFSDKVILQSQQRFKSDCHNV